MRIESTEKPHIVDVNITESVDDVTRIKQAEAERKRIDDVLLIKETKLISHATYHELARVSNLPKSYKIRRREIELNERNEIRPLVGPHEGFRYTFREQFEPRVRLLRLTKSTALMNDQIHVRLSMDGTNIGRRKALLFGFEILNDSLRSRSTRPLAVAFCNEDYDCVKEALSENIEDLRKTQQIRIDGHLVMTNFFS